jgi:hypothetical protein
MKQTIINGVNEVYNQHDVNLENQTFYFSNGILHFEVNLNYPDLDNDIRYTEHSDTTFENEVLSIEHVDTLPSHTSFNIEEGILVDELTGIVIEHFQIPELNSAQSIKYKWQIVGVK